MQERNHIRPFDRPCFFASSKTSSPQRNSSIPFCRTCFLPIQLGAQSLSASTEPASTSTLTQPCPPLSIAAISAVCISLIVFSARSA